MSGSGPVLRPHHGASRDGLGAPHSPSHSAEAPVRRASIGGFLAVVVLAALLALLASCSHAPAPAGSPTVPANAEAVLAQLDDWQAPSLLEGRGLVRLFVDDRSLPSLNARFAIRDSGGGLLSLRPGMLSPVLNLWFEPEEWSLFLPRMKVFARSGGGDDSLGAAIGRLAAYLVSPQRLAKGIQDADTSSRGGAILLRGRSPVREAGARQAEIWLHGAGPAVSRWSLWTSSGESVVRVAYDPPMGGAEYQGRIDFLVPGLGIRGALEVREWKRGGKQPSPPPEPGRDWEEIDPADVPDLLKGVSESERGDEQ